MNPLAIEMTNVVKSFGRRRALDGLNLAVQRGEIYAFLGPNGAGKTTAMRILMGLASATSGEVAVLGSPPGSRAALTATGALIETPALYPGLSGAQHLQAVARWAGVRASRVGAVLETVGLGAVGHKATRAYSLGMKQRLGVATALLKDPALLLLDEPTNGLDPQGMADMRALLARLREAGHTVLLSSHLLSEVEQVADRVGIVVDGRLRREGTLAQLQAEAGGRVVIDAQPVERAAGVLRASGLVPASAVEVRAEQVLIAEVRVGQTSPARSGVGSGPDLIPTLVKALVNADVTVHQVQHQTGSLTEVFLALTSPGAGQAPTTAAAGPSLSIVSAEDRPMTNPVPAVPAKKEVHS
jgi:ABC-2 type transport system ATP-binding protein